MQNVNNIHNSSRMDQMWNKFKHMRILLKCTEYDIKTEQSDRKCAHQWRYFGRSFRLTYIVTKRYIDVFFFFFFFCLSEMGWKPVPSSMQHFRSYRYYFPVDGVRMTVSLMRVTRVLNCRFKLEARSFPLSSGRGKVVPVLN